MVGIMQGRLTNKNGFFPQQFPWESWKDEFYLASKNKIDCIEWMFNYEKYDENPIATLNGREEIKTIVARSGVQVYSVCANYYMQSSIFKREKRFAQRLLEGMKEIGACILVVPLFEKSNPEIANEYILSEVLGYLTEEARRFEIEIAIETDISDEQVLNLLKICNDLRICYDIGNATGKGKNVLQELEALKEKIIEVHIKDKQIGALSTMLGAGDVDFDAIFNSKRIARSNSIYILETYFGQNAVEDTLKNLEFIRKYIA